MTGKSTGKATIFAIMAVLFWSTSPTAFKLGLQSTGSYQLLTAASITSAVILGSILLIRGRKSGYPSIGWKDLVYSAILGLLNPAAYYLILFQAYSILPAQVAQPLNMVWPIVLVILSIPMLRQKISWISIGTMLLSFTGVVLVSLQGGTGGEDPRNRLGVFLALSTSLIWAVYWIFNARDRAEPVTRLFLNFTFASVYLLAGSILTGELFPATAPGWYASVYVGIFEMGITFVLWLKAMQLARATDRISNLVFLAPFLNLFFVKTVLDERIFLTTVFGIILIVSGIIIQNLTGRHAKIT